MKKSVKIISTGLLLSALVSSGLVAQNFKPAGNQPDANAPSLDAPSFDQEKKHGRRGPCFDIMDNDEEKIIGTVKSVNTGSNQITVTNTDGKDVTVAVTPFTKICIQGERKAPKDDEKPSSKELPPPKSSITDLTKGDWVIVSPAKTDTKTPVAGVIFISKAEAEKK